MPNTNGATQGQMRAAAYIRVSTEKQAAEEKVSLVPKPAASSPPCASSPTIITSRVKAGCFKKASALQVDSIPIGASSHN